MRLLAIETSSARGSLCLAEINNQTLNLCHEVSWHKLGSHSEVILDQLNQLLSSVNWAASDLTHLAVGIGPGSFTGIRVGLSLAKTLGYGLNLPTLGINSLEITASRHFNQSLPVLVLMNAFRNQLYGAAYQQGREILPPGLFTVAELENYVDTTYVGCGDGFDLHRSLWSSTFIENIANFPSSESLPRAEDLCRYVATGFRPEKFNAWRNLKPLYVRPSSAEEKLKDGALKPQKVF